MKTYEINFIGRLVGAIGIFEFFTVNVIAETEKEAVLKLYETHEHISAMSVKVLEGK